MEKDKKTMATENIGRQMLQMKKDIANAIARERKQIEKLNQYGKFGYTEINPIDLRGLKYEKMLEFLERSIKEKAEMFERRKTKVLREIVNKAIQECPEGERIELKDNRYANFSGYVRGGYMRRKEDDAVAYLKSPAGKIIVITAPKEQILENFFELDVNPIKAEVQFVK